MSLIIKGMKLPKRHLFEGFVAIGDGQIVVKDLENNKLFEGEIKEIPTPHGRLIDADKLLESFGEALDEDRHFVNYFALVDEAPTIIEAEVSE